MLIYYIDHYNNLYYMCIILNVNLNLNKYIYVNKDEYIIVTDTYLLKLCIT
jgi:hypothetical protein